MLHLTLTIRLYLPQGCLNPVVAKIPQGSILWPSDTSAVVGGNVLTSQRLLDVILKAFDAAAASQGCMNNFTMGNGTFLSQNVEHFVS